MMKKIFGILFMIFGFWILFIAVTDNGMSRWFTDGDQQTQSALPDGVDTIVISASGANVNVIPEERQNVTAELHEKGLNHTRLEVERDRGEIRIRLEHGWLDWLPFGEALTLDVYVPQDYNQNMAVDLGSGNLNFHGLSKNNRMVLNRFELDMNSGNVDLQNLRIDQWNYDGASGNVEVSRVAAKAASLDIRSGNITLEHYTGALNVELSSGRLNVQMDELEGPVDIQASSGIISLNLPDDADFTFRGRVSSGKIDCDFPLQNKVVEDGHVVGGSYGTGEYAIHLGVSSGIIHMR